MKVCTDACLFGAWAASKAQTMISRCERILDIGAGTGLLSLMLAQEINARIDGVEIEVEAAKQATENVSASPWNDRVLIHHSAIQDFEPGNYDAIISNPPFFTKSLQSFDALNNLAKHNDSLSYAELAATVSYKLKNHGCFFTMLPPDAFTLFKKYAEKQKLFLKEKVQVMQTSSHTSFRTMAIFTKGVNESAVEKFMVIKDEGLYTETFATLLKDYYLYL